MRLWDLRTGSLLKTFDAVFDVAQIRLLSDNATAVWACSDGSVSSCQLSSGTIKPLLKANSPTCLGLWVDATRLLAAYSDGTVKLWDLTTGKAAAPTRTVGCTSDCVELSPDGRHAMIGGADRLMRMWDLTARSRPRARRSPGRGNFNRVFG